jgi:multiple sugar transport system permease protein
MTKAEAKMNKWKKFWARNKASEGYLFKKVAGDYVYRFVRILMLFGLCFLILQPIFNKISVSFMAEEDLYNPMVINFPEHFSAGNYEMAATFMGYGEALKNSFVISLTIAILQVAMCTLVGYGFARFNFPLKKLWFACVILTVVIPPQIIASPLILHFRFFDIFGLIEAVKGETINLRGSVLPYYLMSAGCMGLKNGLYIYMTRQFFRNQPKELEEAAVVDGAGFLRTFFQIMLPCAKPAIITVAVFSLVWQYNDSFYASLFGVSSDYQLGVKLSSLGGTLDSLDKIVNPEFQELYLSAGVVMMIIPILIIYIILQKSFIEGVERSGIVG